MKKILALSLALISFALLSACGLKAAIQDGVKSLMGAPSASATAPAGGGWGSASESHLGTTPSGEPRVLATAPSGLTFEDRMDWEWQNEPEEGFVWTITIHDVDVIDVMGLCTATYNVNLSASHVGPTLYGTYKGDFAFDYEADMSGLEWLLTAQGGSVEYDTDGWFENDGFLFRLEAYDPAIEEVIDYIINSGSEYANMTAEEKAIADAYMAQIFDLDNEEPFEKENEPEAIWWNLDIPMTDGDMSGYFEMNGLMGGILDGSSEVDSTGKNVVADAHVAFGIYGMGGLILAYDERYAATDTVENPLIHTIKVYPGGEVVMTFYSATGGPVTTKCYGFIDKIAVEDTLVIKK